MMLHRHFEEERKQAEKEKTGEFVSEVFPPDEQQPKRGRKKKSETD